MLMSTLIHLFVAFCWTMPRSGIAGYLLMFSVGRFYVYFLHSTGDFDSWPRLSIRSTQKEGLKPHSQSMDELIKDGILR